MIGPDKFKRDSNGLLETQEYSFKENGSVDWRAMVSDEHLYPNKDWFLSKGKEVPNSVEGLKDYQLLIKLSGIREIALVRGFNRVEFDVLESSKERAVVSCSINFIENYESPETKFSSIANATTENTDSFAQKFLESIAENRAYVRCVRAFLNIPIVGADEIDKSDNKANNEESVNSASFSPQSSLQNQASKRGMAAFDDFKEFLRSAWSSGDFKSEAAKDWKSFQDVPSKDCRTLMSLLNK